MQPSIRRLSHTLAAARQGPWRHLAERLRPLRGHLETGSLSQTLALLGAAIGALGLLAWILGRGALTVLVEADSGMTPLGALALALLGTGAAVRRERASRGGRVVSFAAALGALVIGLLTLAEYVFAPSWSIDELLVPVHGGPYPGRMSPASAVAIVLLGVATLLLDVMPRARVRPSEWLSLAAAFVALSALFAYLFGGGPLYRGDHRSVASVAVPTGLSLLLTSGGLLLDHAGGEVVRLASSAGPGGVLLRRMAVATVLAPGVFALLLSRALVALGFDDLPIIYGTLVSGTMLAGVALLTATARPLDRMHEQVRWEKAFFAKVGTALTTTLDADSSLRRLADVVVEDLADVCVVDTFDERAVLRRVVVTGHDASKASAYAAFERLPIDRDLPHLAREVLETRAPVLYEELTPAEIEGLAQNEEHLAILRALEPTSLIGVPLLAGDRLLGGVLLVASSDERRFGPRELGYAVELADRTSRWLEKVRLYREAQRAIRDRDDVLGVVVHDLRNPLGTILLQATLLRYLLEAHDLPRKPADVIERAARRMNRLVGDLLDVTRLEAGHLLLERASLSPAQIVIEALESQRARAPSSPVHLHVEIDEDLPNVWADRDRLLQVFENLIGNAVKFTPEGGHVTVGAGAHEGAVVFRVADSGVGLEPEDIPHLFDRFWQKQAGDPRGAGLGLPIVKGIVEAHGGRIWVESTPGEGSTFFFTVPAAFHGDRALSSEPRVPGDTDVSSGPRDA